MEGVTAIETFEIKEEEDGVEEDEESAEEDVEDTTMPEDASAADSRDESTDWDGLFRCLHCEEVFEEKAAFLEHQRLHDEPLLSGDTAAPPDGLLVSTGEGRQTMCCSLCGRIFSDSRGFYSHMMKHRNKLSKKTVAAEPGSRASKQHVYECEDCGKSYAVIGHFLNHQRSHKQASKSVFHDLADLKKKSFQCHTCGRSYSRASALDAHRRCHEVKLVKSRNRGAEKTSPAEGPVLTGGGKHKVKPEPADDTQKLHECPCGKAFRAPSGLRTHQRFSHNDKCSPEKPKTEPKRLQFDCTECDKTYGSRVALVSHQRWHKNRSHIAGKFSCEECGKVFTTLTFYYKHQRLAHSAEETPSKSFLHQVCQLQKKAFECQDCGLRFSRASALQSHQLCHVDVFKEAEKLSAEPTSPLPRHELSSRNKEEAELQVSSQDNIHAPLTETDAYANDTDGDTDDSETGDFNVEVISVSASDDEEETIQDLDPDLELLCESDQEGKEETDFYQSGISPRTLQSKPDMGLKIVQIDFDPSEDRLGEETETRDETSNEKEVKLCSMRCQDCGQQFTRWEAFKTHLRMHVLEEEEGRRRSNKRNTEDGGQSDEEEPAPEKRQRTSRDRGDAEEDAESSDVDVDGVDDSIFDSSWQVKPSEIIKVRPRVAMLSAEEKPIFNNSNRVYACAICGKVYSYLESFRNHQKMHENEAVRGQEHKCPDCGKSFVRPALLMAHLKVHRSPMQTEPFAMKCAQCNKSFSSMQTWMSHMDIHKQKPFWCLACAKGFKDEVALDKHLQGHNLKRHQCNICFKNFRVPAELRYHYNTHSGDKPFKCTLCKKTFSQLGNLITHRKKHVGVYVGESKIPVGGKKSRKRMVTEMKKLVFPGVDRSEDFEMEGEEGEREASESAAVSESSSEESGSESESGSDSVESAEEGEPAAGKGADVAEGGKQDGHGEWECFECGMELDQEADLHLHYMKHARGELPVH